MPFLQLLYNEIGNVVKAMMKKTFKYCATHKEDEEYMRMMCSKGWAAIQLIEGFWTFEKCEPNQYCYRIGYLRGKNKDEINSIIENYSKQGIEFVSRYSFWAIFRSTENFELYTKEEELELCQKIYSPMPIGALISCILCIIGLVCSYKINVSFILISIVTGTYGCICIWLAVSYHKLIQKRT